jgi:hypothetical protein
MRLMRRGSLRRPRECFTVMAKTISLARCILSAPAGQVILLRENQIALRVTYIYRAEQADR